MYYNYTLLYENYCAEQKLINNLSLLYVKMSGPLTESYTIALQESVKDTIMDYIKKIVANIQNAWNKFKASIDDTVIRDLLSKNEKYLGTGFTAKIPEGFKIPLLQEFDKFNSKKLVDFGNYNAMKEYLGSEDEFMGKYYPDFVGDDKKSVKEVLLDKIFKESDGNSAIGKDGIDKYVSFLKNFKSTYTDLSADITDINTSVRAVEQMVDRIVSTRESAFNFTKTILTYFNEADEDNKEDDGDDKKSTEFTAVSTTNNQNKPDASKEEKDAIYKDVVVFFKCSATILSAKMAACDRIKNSAIEMIRKYCKAQSKTDETEEANPEGQKEETNKTADQVKA